jgi:hypothetical protein
MRATREEKKFNRAEGKKTGRRKVEHGQALTGITGQCHN